MIRGLPLSEAVKLNIYFEEIGKYQYRKRKELESNASSSSPSTPAEQVAFTFGGADEEVDEPWLTQQQ